MGRELSGNKRAAPYTAPPFDRADELSIAESQRESLRSRRCAFCHEDIGRALSRSCEGCGVTLHDFCCREARRCPSIGCERAWDTELRSVRRGRENEALARAALFTVIGWFTLGFIFMVFASGSRGIQITGTFRDLACLMAVALVAWEIWQHVRK